ncbi:MAG: hypothetical protein AAF978_09435, partial [Cyanobacteria bacterium P01_E01_bin.48]
KSSLAATLCKPLNHSALISLTVWNFSVSRITTPAIGYRLENGGPTRAEAKVKIRWRSLGRDTASA